MCACWSCVKIISDMSCTDIAGMVCGLVVLNEGHSYAVSKEMEEASKQTVVS